MGCGPRVPGPCIVGMFNYISGRCTKYNEVKGYADAARWVYGQAIEPGDWHNGLVLTMSEVRHVHHLAMTPVWDVAPHPDATAREGPGSFREHDIHPFPGGMTPPTWPLVAARMHQWVEDVCATTDPCLSWRLRA
jgi:hypothetical protein